MISKTRRRLQSLGNHLDMPCNFELRVLLPSEEQGWRSGESARLPPMCSGFDSRPGPGVICGLSLLVLYSALRGFSPGTPVFPSPQQPTVDLIGLI